jgi:Domain of unknown function (DUF4275)
MSSLNAILTGASVEAVRLSNTVARSLHDRWRTTFAFALPSTRKRSSGDTLAWHVFSWNHAPCHERAAAEDAYWQEYGGTIFVLGGSASVAWRANVQELPDLSGLREDFYVCPEDFSWTMVFTHEDDFGPYFTTAKMVRRIAR